MSGKNPIGKRVELRDKYGMNTKFAMHTVRLLYEAEMLLAEHDLDLQRHSEHLKAIRRGLYHKSTLPWGPDEEKIKGLLLKCLEMHYGNLGGAVVDVSVYKKSLQEIDRIVQTALWA